MKELLFSLTAKDFDWQPVKGSGKGGQHRNKRFTGWRVVHKPSGARASATELKSSKQNRRLAFEKIAKDPKLLNWIKIKAAFTSKELSDIEKNIDRDLDNNSITKVEVMKDGKWVEE